jgi:hypothetical protein
MAALFFHIGVLAVDDALALFGLAGRFGGGVARFDDRGFGGAAGFFTELVDPLA